MVPRDLQILVVPVYTARDPMKCSTFWALRQIVQGIIEKYKDATVTCLVPDEQSVFHFDSDPAQDGWTYIPVNYHADRFLNWWLPSDEWERIVSVYGGDVGDYDVLLTSMVNGSFWRSTSPYSSKGNQLQILYDTYPYLPFKSCMLFDAPDVRAMQTFSSYLAFDRIYIEAEWERREIMQLSAKYLSATMRKELQRKLIAAYPSNDLDPDYVLSDEAQQAFLSDRFQLVYAQRISNGQKKFGDVYSLYQKLHALNAPIETSICTPSVDCLPEYTKADRSFFKLHSFGREDFWSFLKNVHATISFSMEEDQPKALTEAIMLGVIPVVKKRPWSLGFCGPDYPFFCVTVADAYERLTWIESHREEAWIMFTDWYENYFRPKVLSQGNAVPLIISDIEKHCKALHTLSQVLLRTDELVAIIDKEVKVGEDLDLMRIDLPGVKNVYDVRELARDNWKYVVFSRLPKRYYLHYILRTHLGFVRSAHSWVLRRKEKKNSANVCTEEAI